MLQVILDGLEVSAKAISDINRVLTRQDKSIQRLKLLTVVGAVYIYNQNKKIEKLSKEIEELKEPKGE